MSGDIQSAPRALVFFWVASIWDFNHCRLAGQCWCGGMLICSGMSRSWWWLDVTTPCTPPLCPHWPWTRQVSGVSTALILSVAGYIKQRLGVCWWDDFHSCSNTKNWSILSFTIKFHWKYCLLFLSIHKPQSIYISFLYLCGQPGSAACCIIFPNFPSQEFLSAPGSSSQAPVCYMVLLHNTDQHCQCAKPDRKPIHLAMYFWCSCFCLHLVLYTQTVFSNFAFMFHWRWNLCLEIVAVKAGLWNYAIFSQLKYVLLRNVLRWVRNGRKYLNILVLWEVLHVTPYSYW